MENNEDSIVNDENDITSESETSSQEDSDEEIKEATESKLEIVIKEQDFE